MNRRLIKIKRFLSVFSKYALLSVVALIMIFPFYWMINVSLKTGTAVFEYPPSLFPHSPSLENYSTVLKSTLYPRYFLNSVIVSAVETVLVLAVSVLCAFGFYRNEFKGKKIFFFTLLIVSSLPFEVVMVYNYKTIVSWGIHDTYTSMILPFVANFFYVYMIYNSFKAIPKELLIASMVDRASSFKFLFKIALPIVKPTLVFVCIMNFIGAWNSFIWPLMVTNSNEMRTVSFGIYAFMSELSSRNELVMAMSVITELPLVIFFLMFKKHFLKGKYT